MKQPTQQELCTFFKDKFEVNYNELNGKYYIVSSIDYMLGCRYYLRKNGVLGNSTFEYELSEGYWDTKDEGTKFLHSWLPNL